MERLKEISPLLLPEVNNFDNLNKQELLLRYNYFDLKSPKNTYKIHFLRTKLCLTDKLTSRNNLISKNIRIYVFVFFPFYDVYTKNFLICTVVLYVSL